MITTLDLDKVEAPGTPPLTERRQEYLEGIFDSLPADLPERFQIDCANQLDLHIDSPRLSNGSKLAEKSQGVQKNIK